MLKVSHIYINRLDTGWKSSICDVRNKNISFLNILE